MSSITVNSADVLNKCGYYYLLSGLLSGSWKIKLMLCLWWEAEMRAVEVQQSFGNHFKESFLLARLKMDKIGLRINLRRSRR